MSFSINWNCKGSINGHLDCYLQAVLELGLLNGLFQKFMERILYDCNYFNVVCDSAYHTKYD